tara:strand:+ start:745 stop:1218 length:474 start_codon:yes stop_codon:yes gene_type:complete
MAIEIERKFLVKTIPVNKIKKSKIIKQGYLVNSKEKVVRIRTKGSDHYLTIKGNTIGLSRLEFEYSIPEQDAKEIFEHLCKSKIIEKTRHYVNHKNHIWEIDEFHGKNQGLVVAEIELSSEKEIFDLPEWIGDEVTQDPRYYNMNLNEYPYLDWGKK